MYINRTKALMIALEAVKQLPQTNENKQTIKRLEEMISDSRVIRTPWTRERVFEVLNKWRDEHGRNPSVTNLMEPEMPPTTTIQRLFDMSASAFLNIHYPRLEKAKRKNRYSTKTEQEWIENFVEQFNYLQPSSARDYNVRRDKNTPTWDTVARYLGLASWKQLLIKVGVKTQCLKVKYGLTQELKTYYVDSTCSSYKKIKELSEKLYDLGLEYLEKEKKRTIEIYRSTP